MNTILMCIAVWLFLTFDSNLEETSMNILWGMLFLGYFVSIVDGFAKKEKK